MEEKESIILKFFLISIFFQTIVFNPWGEEVFLLPKFLFSAVIIFISFLIFFLKKIEEEKLIFRISFLDIPVFLYIFILGISTIFSVYFPVSLREFLLNLTYFVFYLIFVNSVKEISYVKKSIYFIFFVSSIVSIYSILQKLKIDFFNWSEPAYLRPASTLGNPNFLAAYSSIVLPLVVSRILLKREENLKTLIYFFISIILFISLLLTYTRGGWLSFAFSFLVLVLLKKDSLDKKKILFLILFFSIIFSFLNSQPRIPIEGKEFNLFERATSISPSVFVRLNLWRDSLFIFKKYFLTGSGPNTYPIVYPEFRNVKILRIQSITALPEDAHNMFLQVSVTSGILGFFSYIFLLLTFLSKLYKISKSEENWIPPALFSSLIAYIIQSIFNPIVPDIKLLFFGILGFTGAYCKRSDLIIIKNLKFFWKIFLYILISLFLMYLVLPSISNNFAGDYNFRKGKYYEMKGKLDKAVEYLILAVENNPKNPSYHRELGFVYREIAKFKNLPRDKKKYFLEESIKKYQDAIKLNPYDASLYSDLAKVYSIYAEELDKKFSQKAIKCYEIAIKKDPNYSIFHNYLGVLYLNLGKYKNAEKEFEIAKKLTPNFIEPYINLGVLYYKNKNYQKAIEISIQAIKNNLESVELYANLGIFYKEIKEYKKAKKMIERAIKLNPDNPSLEKLLGEIEEEWKKNSKKY